MTYSRATFGSGRRPLLGTAPSSLRQSCPLCGLCQSGSSTMRCQTYCGMPGTLCGCRLWQSTGDITPGLFSKVLLSITRLPQLSGALAQCWSHLTGMHVALHVRDSV